MPTNDELAACLDMVEAEPEQPETQIEEQNHLEEFAKEKGKWTLFAQKVARAPTEQDLKSVWSFRPR